MNGRALHMSAALDVLKERSNGNITSRNGITESERVWIHGRKEIYLSTDPSRSQFGLAKERRFVGGLEMCVEHTFLVRDERQLTDVFDWFNGKPSDVGAMFDHKLRQAIIT